MSADAEEEVGRGPSKVEGLKVIIAEGEWAAVECRGNVQTRRGERYDNQYCWVCRVQDGRLKEVVEYLDTQLVDAVLQP